MAGATGTMQTDRGSTHTVTFPEVQPPRLFTMTMSGPPMTTVTFTCEVTADNTGSTIAQSVGFSGPLAFILGPLLGAQMASHFVPVLDDLATAAEAT